MQARKLTPNYIPFKIRGTSRQCLNIVKAVTQFCINKELKFLYIKKHKTQQTALQGPLRVCFDMA